MSKAGTDGIVALLRERDIDHMALLFIFAGMQDSLPDTIQRLDRVLDYQRDYRKRLHGHRDRRTVEIVDRAVDIGRSLRAGLQQVHEVDLAGERASDE